MRMLFVAAAVLVTALPLSATQAAAKTYPWCSRLATTGGECAFDTFQQCLDDISGIGGGCIANPSYTGPSANASSSAYGRVKRGRSVSTH